jgi:hypothetical protein
MTRSFQSTERVNTKATNVSKSTVTSTTHFVCFGNAHYSEWSPRTRKRDVEGGQNVITASPNVFSF